jgi:hemerythrin
MTMNWHDGLLTGNRVIDTHHRAFFVQAQRIRVACGLGRGAAEVDKTVAFLIEYAREHFAFEEQAMRAVGFPYMETHCSAHQAFLALLGSLADKLAKADDKTPIGAQVAELTEEWFTRHIRGADQPLTRFLEENQAAN